MAVNINFQTTGEKQVIRALNRAADRLSDRDRYNAIRRVLYRYNAAVVKKVRPQIPVVTGNLRKTFSVRNLQPKGNLPPASVTGFRIRKGAGVSVSQLLGNVYGNRKVKPLNPNMVVKAFETEVVAKQDRIIADLHIELEKSFQSVRINNRG